jgi:tripartite-type tricarboxylate transporter receptor subunit TctC
MPRIRRWAQFGAVSIVAGLVLLTTTSLARSWPQRTVRILVPFGAGTAPDITARLFADHLSVRWKQPVIVENRPGAGGLIGVTAFATTRDDHALLFSPAAPISVFPFTQEKLAYDPARDFVPISLATDTFGAIATSGSLNVGSLADLVMLARAEPGKLNWTSGGGAFPILLAGFVRNASIDIVEVPYRDLNFALQDLAAARVHILITSLMPLLPLAESGKIRFLAVTNKKRAPIVPEIPTATEAGYPELQFEGGVGFFGWRGMPADLRDQIAADIRAVASDAGIIERLATAGQIARWSTPAEFAAEIEDQRTKIASIVKMIGIKSRRR